MADIELHLCIEGAELDTHIMQSKTSAFIHSQTIWEGVLQSNKQAHYWFSTEFYDIQLHI